MQLINSILFLAALGAASPLLVERQAPLATIKSVSAVGSGCPNTTNAHVLANINADSLSGDIDFLTFYNASVPTGNREPGCRITWIVNFPIGCTAVNFTSGYFGPIEGPVGTRVTASLNAPYSLSPSSGPLNAPPARQPIVPDGFSTFNRIDKPNANVRVVNANERDHIFVIDSSIQLQPANGPAANVRLSIHTFSVEEQRAC